MNKSIITISTVIGSAIGLIIRGSLLTLGAYATLKLLGAI